MHYADISRRRVRRVHRTNPFRRKRHATFAPRGASEQPAGPIRHGNSWRATSYERRESPELDRTGRRSSPEVIVSSGRCGC